MRRADWEQALADYLDGKREAAFAWGVCDCAMFAAGAIKAMTGVDPAADIRGKYKSQAGAGRAIKQRGCADLGEWVSGILEEIHPAHARRGDVVMDRGNLGICSGQIAYFIGEENGEPGLVSRPVLECERAWRVPFSE